MQQLLDAVRLRQQLVHFARRYRWCYLGAAALYLAGLLFVRLTGLVADGFTPATLLVVPLAALLPALLFQRRPTQLHAARAVDAGLKTNDLFLTAAAIEHAPGAYRDLVLETAAHRARAVRPAVIVPFTGARPALAGLLLLLLLAAGVWWLPHCDPFGREHRRQQLAQQQERLREMQRATQARVALLQQETTAADPAKAAVAELLQTFNQMKPADKAGNLAQLGDRQKELGQLWRKLGDEKLRAAATTAGSPQNFGLGDPAKIAQWKADLQKGDAGSLNRELAALKQIAERLNDAADPVEREKLRQEIMDRLQTLADTLAQQANQAPLNAALQRALQQCEMAGNQNFATEALQSLAESLNLTQAELQQLTQNIQDLKTLEQALQTLQQAKRLNEAGQLNGQQCQGLRNLDDYAAAFAAALAGQGLGQPGDQPGPGNQGGPGVGKRPTADDSLVTGYKPDQASSPFQPGEILLQWKTRGLSDPGQAKLAYEQALRAARQQASEAIVQEQIPTSYHSTIQKYFDAIHEDQAPPPRP